jgi:hypothetical protein
VKLDAENGLTVTSVKGGGLVTLAGIKVVGDDVWTAQLYDIFSLDQKKNHDLTPQWKGNDGAGQVWLADNIDVFYQEDGSQLVLSPAYSMVSESAVNNVLQHNYYAMSGVLFMYQLMTMCTKGESLQEALMDPEINLSLSNTYIEEGVDPKPLKVMHDDDSLQGLRRHLRWILLDRPGNGQPRTNARNYARQWKRPGTVGGGQLTGTCYASSRWLRNCVQIGNLWR